MTTRLSLSPLPADLPHIAVLLLWYPLFTQPFIFRDIESLRQDLPLEIYTLYGKNLRHCSQEMQLADHDITHLGSRALIKILGASCRLLVKHPRRFFSLCRSVLGYKWPSLEICGENLWAMLCGIYLAPQLKNAGIDLLYAPWPRGTCTAARTISLLTSIPYITCARGDNLEPADPDLVDKLTSAYMIRTNNQADAKRIQALVGASCPKVTVIYNSLTLTTGTPALIPMQKPVRLLAVGRFDPTKGFDILLKACALVKAQGRSFQLTLVGGGGKLMGLGSMGATIHELIKSLHLEAEVELPGLVSHDALPDLLRSHDIFVAPCVIDPSGRRDGIPNTLIEAMSMGLAVIASDINALPEAVQHEQTGLLVPAADEHALAQAIMRLMDDPSLARKLGKAAAAFAATTFSVKANGERLKEFFQDAWQTRSKICAE